MGQNDWADLGSGLLTTAVARGVTAGITPPSGGGSFVYGYHSLDGTSTGAVGKSCGLSGYAPTSAGGSVRGALKRLSSTANTGFSPFLFGCAAGTSVNDSAYLLGLKDSDPYKIVLAKATIISGVDEDNTVVKILRESSDEYQISDDLWHQIRLDAIVQDNGDVLLKVYESDISSYAVTSPSWTAIAGMADYIDDALQINTGSDPLGGGHWGFCFSVKEAINRRAAFDAIEVYRAT
jgi:hypothetical protein